LMAISADKTVHIAESYHATYKPASQYHAIIYYESRIGNAREEWVFDDAVYRIEPSSIAEVTRDFYRYDKTESKISKFYPELVRGKRGLLGR